MTQTKVEAPFVANNANFKNLIINGDMQIAQRGTSTTGIGDGDTGFYTCDRWGFAEGGSSAAVFTQTQSTDVPTGQGFSTSLKMDCTTADTSLASNEIFRIDHRIEGKNLQHLAKGTSSAKKVTLSFWVKSSKTGTHIVRYKDQDNSRHICAAYTIASADTWEHKTMTFDGDTTGAFGNDVNKSLQIEWYLFAGSDYTSGTLATSWASSTDANSGVGQVNVADSTDNNWYLTGVQLEVGDQATDFEHLPVDVQLNRCMRYCYVHNNDADSNQMLVFPGASRGSTNKYFYVQHPVPMRDTPSVTLSGELRLINSHADGYQESNDTLTIGGVDVTIQGQNANEKGVTLFWNGAITGLTDTANMSYVMTFVKEANNKLTFDAEL